MSSEPRYYIKVCGECGRAANKVTLTKVSHNEGRRRYLLLCDTCAKKYE